MSLILIMTFTPWIIIGYVYITISKYDDSYAHYKYNLGTVVEPWVEMHGGIVIARRCSKGSCPEYLVKFITTLENGTKVSSSLYFYEFELR